MRRHGSHAASKSVSAVDSASLMRAYDSDFNPSRPIRGSPLNASTIQGLPLELIDRLRSFPLFASAPDSFLAAIGKFLRPSLHQPNEYILTEGDDAKSMYWVVRGAVRVTSRDGESTYAELKPGSFFGEIGILMDIPRTATIIAKLRSLVVKLNKEDLQKVLPDYPQVERAIREEAAERLSILDRMKKGSVTRPTVVSNSFRKRSRDYISGDVVMGEAGEVVEGEVVSNKRRKSPSPSLAEIAASTVLGNTNSTVRQILKELPLFSALPDEILHFLGVNAQPCSFAPFTDILKQGTHGRDVYFLISGEVEVVTESQRSLQCDPSERRNSIARVRARLKAGQYFGEVTSLSLAPQRTATVRSVNQVECLRITGDVLDELWRNWSTELRHQVEHEAKRRLREAQDADLMMQDSLDGAAGSLQSLNSEDEWRNSVPTVTFSEENTEASSPSSHVSADPLDPDPFTNEGLDNLRAKSRRGSLAPPPPEGSPPSAFDPILRAPSPPNAARLSSPLRPRDSSPSPSASSQRRPVSRRPSVMSREASRGGRGRLPDNILVMVFSHLELLDLMRLRLVSSYWHRILSTSPDILHSLRLDRINRHVTDFTIKEYICPFIGSRPQYVNMNNCFHVTDDGFNALVEACGENIRTWKMRSVWDVTGQAILDLVNRAKRLEDIDLSNCRKVGDNLLARIVGWVVPYPPPNQAAPLLPPVHSKRQNAKRGMTVQTNTQHVELPPPGTIIGAANLKRFTLSYCKHVQDRSMAHIAAHASDRIESIDLTRCTSISDHGFQQWSIHNFPKLRKLILADCTYLTDQSIVSVANAARGLRELDLVCLLPTELTGNFDSNLQIVFLLCPVRHGNRSSLSWTHATHTPRSCLLRIRSIRLESSLHRDAPPRAQVSVC